MDFSREGRQKSNVHPTNYISVWYLQWAVLTGIIIDKKQVPEDMEMRNNAAVVTGWTDHEYEYITENARKRVSAGVSYRDAEESNKTF